MESLKKYTSQYKLFIIPIALCIASIYIIFQIIFPKIATITALLQEQDTKETKIQQLRTSIATIESLDEESLRHDLNIANKALPRAKEIVSIYSALADTATKSGVDITSFSLKIGDIFNRNPKDTKFGRQAGVTTPYLSIEINTSSPSYKNYIDFSKALYNTLPMAEVNTIESTRNSTRFEVNFYYKPYDVAKIVRQDIIVPLTPQEQSLLETISEWDQSQ